MRSFRSRKGWFRYSMALVATAVVGGLPFLILPAFAGYELPPGERITNLPHIPRAMPQKEAYEIYDPVIGRNFDLKNLWLRADLRVRPEWRTNTCFGSTNFTSSTVLLGNGACNAFNAKGTPGKANDFYVQQWIRLGIGYDLSPDVNFYMEIIDSANWGSNGSAANAGNGGDPLNHSCSAQAGAPTGGIGCRLGVRAGYVLVRNLANIQGLSMKAGRQYVIFGNHSLFGHFDWANTGYSHDGIMFAYQTQAFDSYLGWFRNSEGDLVQAAPVGSLGPPVAGGTGTAGVQDANRDADMIVFYNQLKNIPGFLIEPYYVYYKNNYGAGTNFAFGGGTPKASNQTRHMVGGRIEMRKGNWDLITENAWQFGAMGNAGCQGQEKCRHINAWASRNWIGYTWYEHKWKPRLAANFDYASGDGRNYCATTGERCATANTFENFFPTNHIHMGYADIIAWKNMWTPQANLQFRPSERDHFEIWYSNMNVASSRDCWYRAAQGCYVQPRAGVTSNHIGDEIDFTWTRMFADGKVAFQATYSEFWPGAYTSANLGTNAPQSWGFVQLWMNF